MLDPSIVAYQRLPSADAVFELRALGLTTVETFLVFWQKIVARHVDHWNHQTFDTYGEVPVYLGQVSDRLAVYAVEDEPDEGVKVTVMLAARRGDATIGGQVWDGADLEFVRRVVLLPRLTDYFS